VNPVQHILIVLLRIYRWTLSPAKMFFFGPTGRCRFTPSCSQFAMDAVKTHGAISGGWLAIRRVCRCHPWGGCGHDPVPPRVAKEKRAALAGADSAMVSPGYSE
jgi:putative membrane protein insertion efficiency factor